MTTLEGFLTRAIYQVHGDPYSKTESRAVRRVSESSEGLKKLPQNLSTQSRENIDK